MPKLPKFLRDRLPAPAPEPMRPATDGRDAPKDWRPIAPPKENLTAYDVVDFAIGNRVVAQHAEGAPEVKATGTSAKGPGRANPQKQILTKKEEASLPTVSNGAQGTVRAVLNRYIIVELDGELGTWEFWKDDFHNMTPPDIGSRYWGGVQVTAADLLPGGVGDTATNQDFDARELAEGRKHELEHTNDLNVATEIARDHLTEDPQYYTKLKKIEGTRTRVRVVVGDLDAEAGIKDWLAPAAIGLGMMTAPGPTTQQAPKQPAPITQQQAPAAQQCTGDTCSVELKRSPLKDAYGAGYEAPQGTKGISVYPNDPQLAEKFDEGQADAADLGADGSLQQRTVTAADLEPQEFVEWQGYDVAIEAVGGETRNADKRYPQHVPADWVGMGYFPGLTAADGDSLDVCVGPASLGGPVFVLEQTKPDEDTHIQWKVMLGFADEDAAVDGFLALWPESMLGRVESFAADAFMDAMPLLIQPGSKAARVRVSAADIKQSNSERCTACVASNSRTAGRKTLERLLKNNPDDKDALELLAKGDPTNNHDWLDGMYKWYKAQQKLGVDDAAAIVDVAHDLDRYTPALKELNKGVNPSQYRSFADAKAEIATLKAKRVTPKLRKRDAQYAEVAKGDGFVVYRADNKAAACTLGSDSDWCSAKWNQDWYENRLKMAGGNTVYIARFDDGRGYMVRVADGTDEIITAYDKRDRNVFGSDRDPGYKLVRSALINAGIAQGEGSFEGGGGDDDEPEPDWQTTYAVALLADGGRTWGYGLRRAIQRDGFDSVEEAKEWVLENKPELTETGYIIAVASYDANGGYPMEWEVYETVDAAEPVEAYYVTLYADDTQLDSFVQYSSGTEDSPSVKGWLNQHAAELKLTGYRVWKGLVPAWQIEHEDSPDWDFSDPSVTETVKPNKAAKKQITVYALKRGNSILLADDSRDRLERNVAQRNETKYGGYDLVEYVLTAGEWAQYDFIDLSGLAQRAGKVLAAIPLRDAVTYVVWDPEVGPMSSHEDRDDAESAFAERVKQTKSYQDTRTTQLLAVTHPGDIPYFRANMVMSAAKAKRVIMQDVPDASGQESLALPREQRSRRPPDLSGRTPRDDAYLQRNLELLNALPIGAVVKSRNRAGREYTKIDFRGQPIWQDSYGQVRAADIANESPAGLDVLDYGGEQQELGLTGVDLRIAPGNIPEQLNRLPVGTTIDIGNGRQYTKHHDGYWHQSYRGEPDFSGAGRRSDYFSALTDIRVVPQTQVTAGAGVRVTVRDVQAEAFHGTPGGFVELDHDKSGLGTHFGTYLSAHERWNDRRTETDDGVPMWEVRLYDLDIERPLRMTDIGPWHDLHITTPALREEGIVSAEQARAVLRMPEPQAWATLRAAIEAKGYDAIVYRNAIEDKGKDSYIVWRPDQAKLLTTETVDGITRHTGGSARLLRVSGFEILAGPERVEILKKKYPEYTQYIDRLAALDPSGVQYKYLDAALRLFLKSYRREWPAHENANIANQLGELLYSFHRAQKYLGTDKYVPALKTFSKDINQYKTVSDLRERMREVDELLEGVYRVEEMQTKYGKPYEYAIREFTRNDPTGKQEYLRWALEQYGRSQVRSRWYEVKKDWPGETEEESLRAGDRFFKDQADRATTVPDGRRVYLTVNHIDAAVADGTIAKTQPTVEERKAEVQKIQNAYGGYHELKQQADKVRSGFGDELPALENLSLAEATNLQEKYAPVLSATPPPVAAETDAYTAYGPITNKNQLCAIGTEGWCVARWNQEYFESDSYMGDESGDPHFYVIAAKDGSTKYLAFVRNNRVVEFRNPHNKAVSENEFSDIFEALGLAPSLVSVWFVTYSGSSGDILYADTTRRAVAAYVNDDIALRGSGYDLLSGQVSAAALREAHDSADYSDLEITDEKREESFEPETETRFLVGTADADITDPTDALAAFDNLIDAREYAGRRGDDYTIWTAEVPVHLVDATVRYWELIGVTLVAKVALGTGDQTQTLYALFMRDERGGWALQRTAARISLLEPVGGVVTHATVIKEFTLTAQEAALLAADAPTVDLTDILDFEKGRTIRQYEAQPVDAYFVLLDGEPRQVFETSIGAEAAYEVYLRAHKAFDVQLVTGKLAANVLRDDVKRAYAAAQDKRVLHTRPESGAHDTHALVTGANERLLQQLLPGAEGRAFTDAPYVREWAGWVNWQKTDGGNFVVWATGEGATGGGEVPLTATQLAAITHGNVIVDSEPARQGELPLASRVPWQRGVPGVTLQRGPQTTNPNEVTENPIRVDASMLAVATPAPLVRIGAFDVLAGPERLKVLKEKHPDKALLLDSLAENDPSGEQYKYLDWMLRFSGKNPDVSPHSLGQSLARLYAVMPYLGKGELKEQAKDINKYKTLADINAVLDVAEPWLRKREADYETVFEDDEWVAYDAKNKAAMCELADNIDPDAGYSYWCVARPSQEHYESYARSPHRFIMIKSKTNTNTKLRFLAYVKNGEVNEIKDYQDDNPDWDSVPTHVFDDLEISYDAAQEEEDGEVTVYFIVAADSRVVIDTSEDYVRNSAEDDRTLRGWGYEIRTGTVGAAEWEQFDGDNPNSVDVYGDTLVESVDAETETRYMVGPADAEQSDVWDAYETEAEAREWIAAHKDELVATGYRLWSGEVTLGQLDGESTKYWSVGNEKELESVDAADEAADEEIEIYFVRQNASVTGAERQAGIVFATDDWTALQTHITKTSIAATGDFSIYNTQVSAADWYKHALRERAGNYAWLKNYPADALLLDTIPPVLTTRWVISVNNVPRAIYEPQASAAQTDYAGWVTEAAGNNTQSVQLIEITVPAIISRYDYAKNLVHAKTQRIVQQWSKDAQQSLIPTPNTPKSTPGSSRVTQQPKIKSTTLTHSERVQALDAAPAGSVVLVSDLPWADPHSYTKQDGGKWFRTSWGPGSQTFLSAGIARVKYLQLPDAPMIPTPTEQLPLLQSTAVRIDARALLKQAARVRFVDEMNQQGEMPLEQVKPGDRVRLQDEQDRLATVIAVHTDARNLSVKSDLPSLGRRDNGQPHTVAADAITVIVDADDERVSSHRIKARMRTRTAVVQLSPEDMRKWMKMPQEFSIVSAYVSDQQTPQENRAAHTALLRDLAALGFTRADVHPLSGQFKDASGALRPESSFLVLGLGLQDGLALARKYKQQAVVYKSPTGEVAGYYVDGHVVPAVRADQVVTHEQAVDVQPRAPQSHEGLWSKAKGISFEFPIDWDRKIKTEPNKPLSAEEMQQALPPKEKDVNT